MKNGETIDYATVSVNTDKNSQPAALCFFAQLVSFLFHPLFIPAYITAFLLYKHPYAAAGVGEKLKLFRFFSAVFITAFLPAFSIFLMKQLGFIESIFLRTQKDRIIPYIVSMVFYWWAWHVSKNLHFDSSFIALFLATFIGCIAGMMANIYFKISMHGIAVGALFVFFVWMAFSGTVMAGSYLAVATIITGLVCTARLMVSDHRPVEIYAGLFTGMLSQWIAIGIAA
jgi:hypothetical protein